jgi:hypothetical protein
MFCTYWIWFYENVAQHIGLLRRLVFYCDYIPS